MGGLEAKCECNNCQAAAAGHTVGLCDRVYAGMRDGKSYSEMINKVYGKETVASMGSMRQTPPDEQERRQAAVSYLESLGVPWPVFHFVDAGAQGGVKAAWPWGDKYISHAVRFALATRYVVTEAELDEAADYLHSWFAERRNWADAPPEVVTRRGDDGQKQAETEASAEA